VQSLCNIISCMGFRGHCKSRMSTMMICDCDIRSRRFIRYVVPFTLPLLLFYMCSIAYSGPMVLGWNVYMFLSSLELISCRSRITCGLFKNYQLSCVYVFVSETPNNVSQLPWFTQHWLCSSVPCVIQSFLFGAMHHQRCGWILFGAANVDACGAFCLDLLMASTFSNMNFRFSVESAGVGG